MVEAWVFGKFAGGAVDCGVDFRGREVELFLVSLCLVWFHGRLGLWGGGAHLVWPTADYWT